MLANLEQKAPAQTMKEMDKAGIHLDIPSDGKETRILRCVKYSFNACCPQIQQLLFCLAPFGFVLVRATVHQHIKELQESGLFVQFSLPMYHKAMQDAIEWGLLSSDNLLESDLIETRVPNMHSVFPYFLKTKLDELDGTQRKALRTTFKSIYRGFADGLENFMRSKDEKKRVLGLNLCTLEHVNLHRALLMCMEDLECTRIRACLCVYFDKKADYQSGLKLAVLVIKALSAYPLHYRTTEVEMEHAGALIAWSRMQNALNAHHQAQEACAQALVAVQSLKHGANDNKYMLGSIHHEMGHAAAGLRVLLRLVSITSRHWTSGFS